MKCVKSYREDSCPCHKIIDIRFMTNSVSGVLESLETGAIVRKLGTCRSTKLRAVGCAWSRQWSPKWPTPCLIFSRTIREFLCKIFLPRVHSTNNCKIGSYLKHFVVGWRGPFGGQCARACALIIAQGYTNDAKAVHVVIGGKVVFVDPSHTTIICSTMC